MGNSEKAERKKKLQEFFNILVIPFVLSIVGSVFSDMTLTALTGIAPGGHKGLGFGVGGLSFGIMCAMVYLWGRPAYLYLQKPDEALKDKIRRRITNIYRDGLLMIVIAQAVSLLPALFAPGLLNKPRLAAAAAAFFAQISLLVVYVDANLSKQKTLMESLYSGPELYRVRAGFTLPVYIKLSIMIAGFAILPFILIYAAFFNRVAWDALGSNLVMMMGLSSVVLFSGLTSVYNGIQKPLDGLIGRMRRVAGGDYAKSRIYFADEVAYLKAGFNDMVDGLKEREELQDTFGKYMSIEIARELIHNKKVNLGGENMEAAVMFCDIRNFTPLSETMSASDLVDFLNKYFHYITPPIAEHNGVINKFIGDAVMAIYTPALGSDDFAADAVRAAIGMRAALEDLNASGEAPGKVEFGIGIHCGKLVAGNIGTAARLEYTFIGDTVNIASRLESKTKDLNTDIVVSATALEKARASLGAGIKFEPLGKVALKGKSEALEIFKLA
ncbi:MAG: hypothetical protein A2X32_09855 [Elusimicrobia bacterium GWC2_64_44]|nr:MAG: hypothetical protein A2X32_09855 [Elusimicrobia bacterium GWC2_64_44]